MAQNVTTWPRVPRTPTTQPSLRQVRRGGWLSVVLAWLISFSLLAGLSLWRYQQNYADRIYQGVTVAGVPLGGLSRAQAAAEIAAQLAPAPGQRLTLRAGDQTWNPTLRELGIVLDAEATVAEAYALGRQGGLLQQLQQQWALLRNGADVAPVLRRDPVAVDAYLSVLARELAREPRDASLTWDGLVARAVPAIPGRELDVVASAAAVAAALEQGTTEPVELVVRERPPTIVGAVEAAEQINAIISAPLLLSFDETTFQQDEAGVTPVPVTHRWTIDRARLAEAIEVEPVALPSGQQEYQVRIDLSSLAPNVEEIAAAIKRPPREARFDYDPETDPLRPLVVSQDGLSLDPAAALEAIEQALLRGEHTVQLPVTVTPPTVPTADPA